MVARAETFARLGGLAESYFAYYEDLDWCWRARLAGLRCHVRPRRRGPPCRRRQHRRPGGRPGPLPGGPQPPADPGPECSLAVLWSQLRSPVDRPESGMALPIARRVIRGLAERRRLARGWSSRPRAVWVAGPDGTNSGERRDYELASVLCAPGRCRGRRGDVQVEQVVVERTVHRAKGTPTTRRMPWTQATIEWCRGWAPSPRPNVKVYSPGFHLGPSDLEGDDVAPGLTGPASSDDPTEFWPNRAFPTRSLMR